MNKDNAKDYLPLVQALADGKMIQFNQNTFNEPCWIDVDRILSSNPAQCYRIKPEPREVWVSRYPNGRYSSCFESKEEAHRWRANDTAVQILFREVIQ